MRAAVEAKRPAFAAEDGDRGHHVWQEAQRFYLVYFTAWEENGVLQRIPDVYGLDHRHSAAANSP